MIICDLTTHLLIFSDSNFGSFNDYSFTREIISPAYKQGVELPMPYCQYVFYEFEKEAYRFIDAIKLQSKKVNHIYELCYSLPISKRIMFSQQISQSMSLLNQLASIAKFKRKYLKNMMESYEQLRFSNSKESMTVLLSSLSHARFNIKAMLHKLKIANDTHSKVVDKSVFDYTYSIDSIMRVYAVLDVVTLFPFLLAGFFGMNVQMPMSEWKYCGGFIVVISVSILYVIGSALWARRLRHHR